jgi:REP element-mobilizing transposase RayT
MEKYRLIEGIGVYFVTFTVVEWLPVFTDEPPCKIITDSLNFCIEKKHLRVTAYVIMSNHFHATLFDKDFDNERLKQTLDDMRKFTGRQLADYCGRKLSPVITEAFRDHAGKDRQRRFWQPTQHPVGLFSEKVFEQKVNYIHWNPCRKGLVRQPGDWRFSSAGFWLKGLKNDVELSGVWW